MDEDIRKSLEYEEQFFGISSLFFSDCFKKFVKDELDLKIMVLTKNLKRKLLHQAKHPEQFDASLQNMNRDLSVEYFNILDGLFPEIAAKISTFVSVPSNILLKEDLFVKSGIHGILNGIYKEIDILKSIFLSLMYVKKKLLEELQEADSALLCMECLVKEN